jgi:hypothetical protein
MAEKSGVAQRNIFVRGLTAIALVAACLLGFLSFSTPANAWRGRGFYGGRGYARGYGRGHWRGRGYGRGYGLYVAPPVYYGRGCYWSRRWGRTICPY